MGGRWGTHCVVSPSRVARMAVVVLVVVLGMIVGLWCDRVSIPAWQARNRYRIVAWGLLLGLLLVTHKALLWHQELVLQIRLCP